MATLRKLPTMVAVAAFTAALSGCGGGNDNEVGALNDNIAALNDDIAALQTRVSTLMTDLEAAQGQRDSANAEVTRLEGELGGEEAEVTRLTGGLASANAEVTRLEGELEDEEAEVTRLEGELEDEEAEVTRLTGELASANARGTRLQGLLDSANAEETRLQGLLDGERGEVNRLQGELTTAQSAAAVARVQVGTLQGQLDTEKMEVTRLMQALTDAGTAATTERTQLQGLLNTANAKVTQLEADLADANRTANNTTTERTRLQGLLDTANANVRRLTSDLRTANTEARNLDRDLIAEKDRVTQLEGDVSRLNTRISSLNTRISSLEGQLRSQQAGIVTENAIVRAESIVKVISNDSLVKKMGTSFESLLPPLPFGNPTAPGPEIKRSSVSRGNTVTVMLPVSSVEGDLEFSVGTATAATGTEAAARDGWNGVTLTRTRTNGSVDEVTIYSDIEAADALTLDSDEKEELKTIDNPRLETLGRLKPGDKVVRITPNNENAKYVSDIAVRDLRNKKNGEHFRGTYRGISGEFTCHVGCDLSVDRDGIYSFDGNSTNSSPVLLFKPDRLDATYDRQDNDGYLYFGWWLHSPTLDNRAHEIRAFYGRGKDADAADMPDRTRNFPRVSESETTYYDYRGVAAGQYVRQTRSGGEVTSAEFGDFTARARLRAEVDANNTKVKGSITNFVTDGAAQSGWEVKLGEADVNNKGSWTKNSVTVGFGIEDPTGQGVWTGGFYWSAAVSERPDSAIGDFNVSSDDKTGHIIGAFGVTQ